MIGGDCVNGAGRTDFLYLHMKLDKSFHLIVKGSARDHRSLKRNDVKIAGMGKSNQLPLWLS